MIDYKLAKQLKEAGFRQDTGVYTCPCEEKDHGFNCEVDYVAVPTLIELIKDCGRGFSGLNRNTYEGIAVDEQWEASWVRPLHESSERGGFVMGKTPEIAVAKLWLKLND